jgi:hypothetical protein
MNNKLLLPFIFVLLTFLGKAQCNASFSPIDISYNGQTKSIPATMQTDMVYVCGSSVMYDTLTPGGIKYRNVYVSTGGTYYYKSTLTNNQMTLWAKSGSNIVILPGTNTSFSFIVYQETGATINNLSSGTITVNNCSVVTGPNVNCSATGITTNAINDIQTNVWPNPAHDKLFISSENGKDKTVSIVNVIGETVYAQKGIKDEKQEISLSQLTSGIYYVMIKGDGNTETKKIVVTK